MREFNTIILNVDDMGIANLTLNRADKHNAMNAEMIGELSEAAKLCGADPAIRAVVLRANGKSFCAGGDLAWMRAQADADRAGKIKEASALSNMLFELYQLPKPLIAVVQGAAYGGGIGLMSVCDIVLADPKCKFSLTETKLGLIPATIGPFVVRRLGEGAARQVFFTGKLFDGADAQKLGLVSSVSEDLEQAVATEIKSILKTAPQASARAKSLCLKLSGGISQKDIDHSIDALADAWESEEAKHGISSFFAQTKPDWAK